MTLQEYIDARVAAGLNITPATEEVAKICCTSSRAVRHWLYGSHPMPAYAIRLLDIYTRMTKAERFKYFV